MRKRREGSFLLGSALSSAHSRSLRHRSQLSPTAPILCSISHPVTGGQGRHLRRGVAPTHLSVVLTLHFPHLLLPTSVPRRHRAGQRHHRPSAANAPQRAHQRRVGQTAADAWPAPPRGTGTGAGLSRSVSVAASCARGVLRSDNAGAGLLVQLDGHAGHVRGDARCWTCVMVWLGACGGRREVLVMLVLV